MSVCDASGSGRRFSDFAFIIEKPLRISSSQQREGNLLSTKAKRLPPSLAKVFLELSALNLTGAKATRANRNGLIRSVYNSLNLTDVRLPGSVCFTVRVGNVMSKGNALAAYTALSHFDTS